MVLLSSRLSLLIVITQCQGNLLRSLRPTTVKVSEIHFAISSLPNSIPRGYENTSINRSTKVNALHKFKTHARYRLCLDHTSHCFLSTLDFLSSHSALAFPRLPATSRRHHATASSRSLNIDFGVLGASEALSVFRKATWDFHPTVTLIRTLTLRLLVAPHHSGLCSGHVRLDCQPWLSWWTLRWMSAPQQCLTVYLEGLG